jgi:hypothetical protein
MQPAMEAFMAMHDHDYSSAPLRRDYRRNAFHHARRPEEEFDKSTLWAGAMLGAALMMFVANMMMAGPPT